MADPVILGAVGPASH